MKFPYTVIHPKTGERVHPARLVADAVKAGEVRTRGNVVDLLLDNLDYETISDSDAVVYDTIFRWSVYHACLTVNARFWVTGPGTSAVKLTLASHCSLHHFHKWDNGEGFSHEYREWRHDVTHVTRQVHSGGTDCDGRHSHFQEDTCWIGNLDAVKLGHEQAGWPDGWPQWSNVRASQRDYAAEAMGY